MISDDERQRRKTETSPYYVNVSGESREDLRHESPSAARNTGPILAAAHPFLPLNGTALELASGTGQHAVAFGAAHPGLEWQPSDPDPAARGSIRAWIEESGLGNVRPPLNLDLTAPAWEDSAGGPFQAMLVCNMIHISPWEATQGLLRGAGRLLPESGRLLIYGCFSRNGSHISDSNAEFHATLVQRNPAWGVRDVEAVAAEAEKHGLHLAETHSMPANNLFLVLGKGTAI